MLDDDGHLCQSFRKSLLQSLDHFDAGIRLPGLLPLDLDWRGIGQTAGVALWVRDGGVVAASILMNGVEADDEFEAIRRLFSLNSLTAPAHVWNTLRRANPPVFLTIHPTVESLRDPAIATAAPALANSFFSLFGTAAD